MDTVGPILGLIVAVALAGGLFALWGFLLGRPFYQLVLGLVVAGVVGALLDVAFGWLGGRLREMVEGSMGLPFS